MCVGVRERERVRTPGLGGHGGQGQGCVKQAWREAVVRKCSRAETCRRGRQADTSQSQGSAGGEQTITSRENDHAQNHVPSSVRQEHRCWTTACGRWVTGHPRMGCTGGHLAALQ